MKISFENVSKTFGKVKALDQVSLAIDGGQIVALLGANGAGKTTLIRCLAAIAAPDRGKIVFDGETFGRDRIDLRRKVYFLPDFPPFFWHHTILQNIAITLRQYEADTPDSEARVMALLDEFDLLPLYKRPIQTLSRGQLYKAGLVSMIAADCDVWILDEPFASGMDPNGIDAFRRHAIAAAARGATILYSTQLLDVVERFSDRVCFLHDGHVHAFDTLANLGAASSEGSDVLQEMFRSLRETRA